MLYHQIYWLFFWGFYIAPLFIFFPITDLIRDGNLKQSEHVKVLFKSPIMTLFFEWIGITNVYRYTTLIVPKLLVRFPKPRVIGSDSCSRFWLQNLGTLVQIWPWRFFTSDLALNCLLLKVCMLTSLTDSATEKMSKYTFFQNLTKSLKKVQIWSAKFHLSSLLSWEGRLFTFLQSTVEIIIGKQNIMNYSKLNI